MKNTNKLTLLAVSALLPLAAHAGDEQATQAGEQWQITMQVEMQGMPMAMPAVTHTACLPKKHASIADMVPQNNHSDCKMENVHQSGDKTTFKMACTGQHPMTGEGEIEHGADHYRGTMHVVGDMEGQHVDMTQNFSGKRIGTCAYSAPN